MTRRRRRIRLAGLLLPVLAVAGGCGSSTVSPAASVGSASPAPAGSIANVGSPSAPAVSVEPGSAGTGVTVDASLLDVLPPQVAGTPLEADPATAAQIATDPSLANSAESIAVALAIRPGTSSGDDLAIASVIRLRPGVFSDAWFESWRATYDQGACEVAGGIRSGPTRVSIANRTVFEGTCAGDARTYHVHLTDPTLIVSITAAGPARFGELVVAGLAE